MAPFTIWPVEGHGTLHDKTCEGRGTLHSIVCDVVPGTWGVTIGSTKLYWAVI